MSKPTVLCSIPTKNRYEALMVCLSSIALQTRPPDKIIIYDDSTERIDMRDHPTGHHLFPLLNRKNIQWEVVFTPSKGQHIGHQFANTSDFDYVWRMDDDGVAEPDVLERLLAHMQPDVGAVGGAVFEPGSPSPGGNPNKIHHLFDGGNVQWAPNQGVHEVDHLYSSFLYRPNIVNYKFDMSSVAFREETIFSHRLKRAGYRLIADTSIVTYHFKQSSGGCRDQDYSWAYAWDQIEFLKLMEDEWSMKLISLPSGLGDCLAFKNILPELLEKYDHLIVATCYPEVFENEKNVTSIHKMFTKDVCEQNVYAWMFERNWKGNLIDAFRQMFGLK